MPKYNQKSRIRSALRNVWRWSPTRIEALKASRIGRGSYQCNGCKQIFGPKQVKVDHVEPIVVPGMDTDDWTIYIARLFCPVEYLQILCDPCHTDKTKKERAWLKEMRSKNG